MIQKHRISTNVGKDQVIKVELKQDFDLLEILSLKFTQKDVYTSLCADYGVVCGRISVNNGFGIPNAKVSIFVPLSAEDENDPVISSLYPYKSTSDRNDTNYRYNLLPSRKQHGGHEPTGTFPDQSDILNREEVLEVYEKYYTYTVKTNDAGDFMIWGVPIGSQTLHVDIDLSDIGCFSLRPYDFIKQGIGLDQFKNTYSFKSSEDLNALPQIVSFDKTIEVYPFWGNQELCEIGITRSDFDLSDRGVKIEPKAMLIGGTYTDTNKNSLNKNCQPRQKMGRKCDLHTKTGTIEAIRFTTTKDDNNRPILEKFDLQEDIPEDGSFVFPVPMNMDYVFTNEFGENEITNDPNKGIATSACYRFRFSLDDAGNARVRKSASYLVPNIRDYQTNGTESDKSYAFSTNFGDYPISAVSNDSNRGILYNEYGQYYPRDYFYRLTYNKVYTVSSFQNLNYRGETFSGDRYLGIKEIVPSEEEDCSNDVVTPPVNFGVKNFTFPLLIAEVLLFIEHLLNMVKLLFFNVISKLFISIGYSFMDTCFLGVCPLGGLGRSMVNIGYSIMDTGQKGLRLINYPECEECSGENILTSTGGGGKVNYCIVGTLTYTVLDLPGSLFYNKITNVTFTQPTNGECSTITIPTSISNFISIQTNYGIRNLNGDLFELDSENTVDGLFVSTHLVDGISEDYFSDSKNILIVQSGTYTVDIVDLNNTETGSSNITANLETGCDIYDTPYNESLISLYYSGTTLPRTEILPINYTPGMDIIGTNVSDGDGYELLPSFNGNTYSRTTGSGKSEFSNGIFYIVPGSQSNSRLIDVLKEYYRRKRVGKLFCGGIVNYSFIDNWLSGSLYFFQFKSKKGKFCGDVIKYISSEDRYYYRSAIYNNESSWGINNWTMNNNQKLIGRPTTMVDLGPRDEFIKEICVDPGLDPNCSVSRSIGPSSFQSFGELLGLAINYRMDVSNSEFNINDFFSNTGFTFTNRVLDGDIIQLISTNNEVGIEEFDLQSPKYLGYSYQILDPDLYPQVFKPNGYWGPVPITFEFDEDGERVRACLNEPTHMANNGVTQIQGRLTESSQKVPFFLWDKKGTGFGGIDENSSDDQSWDYTSVQVQPLQGMTYGYNLNNPEDDSSDRYLLLPITYTFSGLSINAGNTTNLVEFDAIISGSSHTNYDSEYPGFTVLEVTSGTLAQPTSGTLYTRYSHAGTWHSQSWDTTKDFIIRKTEDYYSGSKQILSTPFMFYFGLKAGKTGLDKFIQLFGPKGAFPPVE
jgi:hypothetical protein